MKFKQVVTDLDSTEDLFEMANVIPKRTGLKYQIWIQPDTDVLHHSSPRLKVEVDGSRIPVSIEDEPKLLARTMKRIDDFTQLQKWIRLNKETLLNYWHNGMSMDIVEVIQSLKKIT